MPEASRPASIWYRPMVGRRAGEHRTVTPLELLFDLSFVVAVAFAADELHHAVSSDHIGSGVVAYLMVFFAIWWAWMNFTWFASAYDTDDVPYRLATLVQIAGVLILAAGVPRAFEQRDFRVATLGYVVMRLPLVAQWLRVAATFPPRRRTALRFAVGVTACQIGWVAILFLPEAARGPLFLALALAELAVPVWGESAGRTSWHPLHIAERYGLFTLIVLGETILASTIAIRAGLSAGGATGALAALAVSGLLIVYAMWWLYFAAPAGRILVSNRVGFVWGYGHYVIFGSAAAVGAGLAATVDHATHKAHVTEPVAAAAVAVPVALFLLSVWLLHVRPQRRGLRHDIAYPVAALAVLGAVATPAPLPLMALAVAGLVGYSVGFSSWEAGHAGPRSAPGTRSSPE